MTAKQIASVLRHKGIELTCDSVVSVWLSTHGHKSIGGDFTEESCEAVIHRFVRNYKARGKRIMKHPPQQTLF